MVMLGVAVMSRFNGTVIFSVNFWVSFMFSCNVPRELRFYFFKRCTQNLDFNSFRFWFVPACFDVNIMIMIIM